MSPRNLMPSGNTFLEPPNNKHVIAFLMSACRSAEKLEMATRDFTKTSVYTRTNTFGESLVETIASCHFAELFLFFWCELYAERIRPRSIRRGSRRLQVDKT